MSVWKSPVFYFGVLLVMLVALALVAPFTVNWNAWKPEMENYGRKLTGREVSIAGPVEVRLFPWPRLEADDVRLANAKGFGQAPLLSADKVTLRLALAGLFNASLDVEEIALDGPQLNLVRNDAGDMNWQLKPSGDFAGLVSRVKLDRITVRQGSVWFEDHLHDQSTKLTALDASVAADALEGPWRLQGRGQWRGVPAELTFSLGKIEAGQPLRVAASAKPDDAEFPAFGLDGDWDEGHFKGKARLDPQQPDGEKGSLEGELRPLALQAELDWSRNSVRFDKIKIAPSDSRDSGTLIEGTAEIALGQAPKARLQLDSPRVNLDRLLGAQSLERWQRGGLLALANGVFANMPEKLVAEVGLRVNTLTLGGETLNNFRLGGVAEKQAIRIHEVVADLPGRSRMRFDGIVFPASTGAELGGTLAFESFDLRAFSGWSMPWFKTDIPAYWQGTRGRLKLQTNINWSPARILAEDTQFELDGQGGRGKGSLHFGEVPLIDVQAEMASLDLDSYTAANRQIKPAEAVFMALDALPSLLDVGQKAEQRVTLQLGNLKLNNTSAANVALDYEAGLSGLQLKALDVESLGGASIKGEGLIANGQEGPLGELEFTITAADIRPALQMAGLAQDRESSAWQNLIGATQAKLTLGIAATNGTPQVTYALAADSNGISLHADGRALQEQDAKESDTQTTLNIKLPELSKLLQLYGITGTEAAGEAIFEAHVTGQRSKGLDAILSLRNSALNVNYTGKLVPGAAYAGLAGELAVRSPSLANMIALMGAPLIVPADGPLTWQGKVTANAGELTLKHAAGEAQGVPVEIDASIDQEGQVLVEASTGELNLKQILAAVLMPWRGSVPDLADSYATFSADDKKWQAFLKPTSLVTGLGEPIAEAVVALQSNADGRAINIKTPGKRLNLDLQMKPKGASFEIVGQGDILLGNARVFTARDKALVSGTTRIMGQFTSTGQSPAAALSAASGKGQYWAEGVSLNDVTLDGFANGLESATQQAALAKVFDSVVAGPGTQLGARAGTIELNAGEAVLSPLALDAFDASLRISPKVDLSSREVTAAIEIATKRRPELPALTVTYSGEPGNMGTRIGNASLAAKLGYELLAQELAALEQLQKDEAEAIRKQEQQRRDDEERFAAFQAQRGELRGQLRLLRFHQQQRAYNKDAATKAMAEALAIGDKLNREELSTGIKRRAVRRALAEPFLQP